MIIVVPFKHRNVVDVYRVVRLDGKRLKICNKKRSSSCEEGYTICNCLERYNVVTHCDLAE